MSTATYALVFTVVPFVFGVTAVYAERAAGRRGLLVAWVIASALLLGLGILDWRRPPDEGTPLIAYVAFALIPTAAAAWAAERTARAGMPILARLLVAGTVGWLGILALVSVSAMIVGVRG